MLKFYKTLIMRKLQYCGKFGSLDFMRNVEVSERMQKSYTRMFQVFEFQLHSSNEKTFLGSKKGEEIWQNCI